MKLSVITVNKNNVQGLVSTVQSYELIASTETELIVVDAASDDGSVEWLEANCSSDCRWVSEPDNGIYYAMNKGIQRASGRFMLFMNSGDVFDESVKGVEFLTKLTDDRTVYICKSRALNGVVRDPLGLLATRVGEMPACHQSIIYPRSICGEEFKYDVSYKIFSDFDFTVKVLQKSRVKFLDLCLSRREPGGLSRKVSFRKRVEKYSILLKYFGVTGVLLGLLYRFSR